MYITKLIGSLVFSLLIFSLPLFGQSLPYSWDSVTVGGGGYISGMKIHPKNSNIIYLRTDVGGAYRWNTTTRKMEQIVKQRNTSFQGVAGIALHPNNQNLIYLAVDRNNKEDEAAILKSTDRGTTWTVIKTQNFKFGANGGRNNSNTNDRDREGSPIAVNPNNQNELWVGSRGKGLWRLNVSTEKWTRVAVGAIPNNSREQSIRNILFHPSNPNFIYVGHFGRGVYRSSNGGQSFQLINGNANAVKDVSDLSFSKNGTKLYAACRNQGVFRLNNTTTSTNWKNTNPRDKEVNFGFLTVTASPHDDNLVLANPASQGGFNFERLLVSYNSGDSWSRINNVNITSSFLWNNGDSLGQHCSQLTFDPNNSKKLYYTAFSGLWHTVDFQADKVQWRNFMAIGHEEIVNTGLIAYPPNNNGSKIAVNSADHAGWNFGNLQSYPAQDIGDLVAPENNRLRKGAGTAVCEKQPANIVVSSTYDWQDSDGFILASSNAGKSFSALDGYKKSWGKSVLAIARNAPENIVAVTEDGVKYSINGGNTFLAANNINLTVEDNIFFRFRPLTADAGANNTFYLYDRNTGRIHRSVNRGRYWTQRGTVEGGFTLDKESGQSTRLLSAFGRPGHLWINHYEKGIRRSTNGGTTWRTISGVSSAIAMALGKEKSAGAYPTLYFHGKLDGDTEDWFYRSTNEGTSWDRVFHEDNFYVGGALRHLVADRSEFGKFYVGTSGHGVWSATAKNVVTQPDPDQGFTPDPNKSYFIDVERWNLRLSATGSSEDAFTQATSSRGFNTQWQFVPRGNNRWHIQLANNLGNLIRLRTDGTVNADMQRTSSSGGWTYYEITPSEAADGTYYLTLPNGPEGANRLKVDSNGKVLMVGETSTARQVSFRITDTGIGLLPN